MKSFSFIFLSLFLAAHNAWAADITPKSFVSDKPFLLAEAIFLPDYVEKDFNFQKDSSDMQSDACIDYPYTLENCTAPRTPSDPCPSNVAKFKYCTCSSAVYKYDATTCSYHAESPYFPNTNRLLAGEMCQSSNSSALQSTECNCKYFRYTNDASCGNPDLVVDERSSCQENGGQVRYENCKCNRKLYPYLFVGKLRSQAFLDEVRKQCGNENNFLICQNYGEEIAFKCAVDTAYKYDSYSCTTENPNSVIGGEAVQFYNGYGNYVTLYKQCDCPSSYSASCNGALASQFYGKDGSTIACKRKTPVCQMGFFQGLSDQGSANCYDNVHGSLIKVAETCVKRDGSKVYRCACAHSGKWGYSGEFCGTCVKNTDHIICTENGAEISSSCLNEF